MQYLFTIFAYEYEMAFQIPLVPVFRKIITYDKKSWFLFGEFIKYN
jgi:hypothetical protein